MSDSTVNIEVAIENRIIDLVDLESARQIFALANTQNTRTRSDEAILMAALALHAFRDGHACLDVANIDAWRGEHILVGRPMHRFGERHLRPTQTSSDLLRTSKDFRVCPLSLKMTASISLVFFRKK